jgi:hypothetical protein
VGDALHSSAGYFENGRVRVFRLEYDNENGHTYEQIGSDILGTSSFEAAGWDIDLSGDGKRIAIGTDSSQSVIVYDFDDNLQEWDQSARFANEDNPHINYGESVSLSKDGMIIGVGAPNMSERQTDLFKVNTQARIFSVSESSEENIGWSVSVSDDGSRIAVGAPFGDCESTIADNNCGRVRVFDATVSSKSRPLQVGNDIVMPEGTGVEECGRSLDLANDGNTIVVRCIGKAFIATFDGTEWNIIKVFPSISANIGDSVAITSSGTTVAIGNTHSIDVFELVPSTSAPTTSPSTAPSSSFIEDRDDAALPNVSAASSQWDSKDVTLFIVSPTVIVIFILLITFLIYFLRSKKKIERSVLSGDKHTVSATSSAATAAATATATAPEALSVEYINSASIGETFSTTEEVQTEKSPTDAEANFQVMKKLIRPVVDDSDDELDTPFCDVFSNHHCE